MKYLRLYEAYHAQGYKEEIAAEQEKLRVAVERYKEEEERYLKSMKDIEAKWKDENARFKEKTLNTIDICLEPLTDKWSMYEVDSEAHEFYYYDTKSYIPNNELVLTPELMSDMIRSNKRLQSELADKQIFVFIWIEGGQWLTEAINDRICANNDMEPISKHEGMDASVSLDWVVRNLDKVNQYLIAEFVGWSTKLSLVAILVE